ncbi:MAG: hypothetical protein M4579_006195 [Chaenotheca gracillima]|nr:MAG: hypothetical protein M4579_006195 [Chaenotheca gracillima]
MAPAVKTEPNEYETERADKIAKNQALLKELQLSQAAAGVGAKSKRPNNASKPGASKKRKRPVKQEVQDSGPRRTSSRLAGLQADSEVAQRKADKEYEAMREQERAKRQRVSGDLDLKDVVVVGKEWDRSENFLVDAAARGGKYERTFTERDVKETGDTNLKALREKMSGLELYEGFEPNRIKITPERIYSMGFHPLPEKPIVLAGDKLGNLGIFDASQQTGPAVKSEGADEEEDEDDEPEPSITTFKLHTRTISTFLFPPSNGSTLLSASYDSSIRSLDLAASRSTEIYAPASEDEDAPISGLDVPLDSPHTLYFSTLHGGFGRHDTRAPPNNTGGTEHFLLSDKKIGGFTLHPLQPHLVATASLDRTLKIWDLRKISGKGDMRHPALLGEHESKLSVSHAAWNSAGQVATASYDDTVKIHDFGDCAAWKPGHDIGDKGMSPSTVVRHNNQTGRWVTILRAQWQAFPQDGIQKFVIGNMNRFVDVYTSRGEQLAQLGGEGLITAVPAVAQFHPTKDWIAAGTASGKLCLWM